MFLEVFNANVKKGVRGCKKIYVVKAVQDFLHPQYVLPNLMDMGSILGTILRAILNYKRVPMSTLNGPLVKQILTVAHMGIQR